VAGRDPEHLDRPGTGLIVGAGQSWCLRHAGRGTPFPVAARPDGPEPRPAGNRQSCWWRDD